MGCSAELVVLRLIIQQNGSWLAQQCCIGALAPLSSESCLSCTACTFTGCWTSSLSEGSKAGPSQQLRLCSRSTVRRRLQLSCCHSYVAPGPLIVPGLQVAEDAETGRQEKARLRQLEKEKKERLNKLLSEQNALSAVGEVRPQLQLVTSL